MPVVTGALTADGAIVEATIGLGRAQLQALRFAQRPVREPQFLTRQ
jgi:hypothetical protein